MFKESQNFILLSFNCLKNLRIFILLSFNCLKNLRTFILQFYDDKEYAVNRQHRHMSKILFMSMSFATALRSGSGVSAAWLALFCFVSLPTGHWSDNDVSTYKNTAVQTQYSMTAHILEVMSYSSDDIIIVDRHMSYIAR